MKKLTILFSMACMLYAMQAYASCESVLTPSEAAAKAQRGEPDSCCIEGYVVSTEDIYTGHYENQSFMMADQPGGAPVFKAWRVRGVDHTIGIGSYVRIVDATLQMYGNIAETYSGFRVEIISEVPTVVNLPEFGTLLDADEARDLCLSFPYHNQTTEDMFIVCGYAISVATSETDDEIQTVYMSTTHNGEVMFQAWECHAIRNTNGTVIPIEEGDFVYVTGYLSRYNMNAQIKGGYVATSRVKPYSIRVTADPDKGYAQISGTTSFTEQDAYTMACNLEAIPEPGYEFVMWIDPRFVNPSDADSDTDLKVAESILSWYNTVKDFTEDQLQEYLEENRIDPEVFNARVGIIEKLLRSEVTLNEYDLAVWMYLNDMDDEQIFYFSPVFRLVEGIDNVQGDNVQSTKVIENGQLYLMYNGTKYNVQGAVVK